MKFCIKEWADKTATLMTDMGQVIAYYASVYDAIAAFEELCHSNSDIQRYEVKIINHSAALDNYARCAA